MKLLKIGWIILCLLPCWGCSPARTKTEIITLTPPGTLLLPVAEPALSGSRNRDLLDYALRLRTALREANADKAALRVWAIDSAARPNSKDAK
jgi:hypothetical protein